MTAPWHEYLIALVLGRGNRDGDPWGALGQSSHPASSGFHERPCLKTNKVESNRGHTSKLTSGFHIHVTYEHIHPQDSCTYTYTLHTHTQAN